MQKDILNNIDKADIQYITDINSNIEENKDLVKDENDIIFIAKLLGFYNKFKILHWAAYNDSIHIRVNEFSEILNNFIDAIAENLQSIIGQFTVEDITKVNIPIENDPISVINSLKDEVNNWFEIHQEDIEYEGCRNIISGFLENIHKYIYLFRLCKK